MNTNMSVKVCGQTPTQTITPFIPNDIDQSIILNPLVWEQKRSTQFEKVKGHQRCPSTQYYAPRDGRLISTIRGGQTTTLDEPPITGSLSFSDILDSKELNHYGQNYNSYQDVTAGQIRYHIDEDLVDPYYEPNFTIETKQYDYLYKDPMGAVKPEYARYLGDHMNNPLTRELKTDGGLSWINDSTAFREDLMSRQMRKINQQKYESRWYQ